MRRLGKMGHITIGGTSRSNVRKHLDVELTIGNIESYDSDTPRVAIIMEFDSDFPTMKDAAKMLSTFHVSFEITTVSAHCTPGRMYSYVRFAKERGIEIIIAGAGAGAHLSGMMSLLTLLPVIGVPIRTSSLDGVDSLLSIMQKDIPVATVAIGDAASATLLAVRMPAIKDGELRERLIKCQE